MTSLLYNVFIFPVEQIVELAYVFAFRLFQNPGASILGVSLAVSVLTLPLYLMAEKLQNAERETQKRMKRKVNDIKAVFSGDERFMRLQVYYRQNCWHPLYALRTSVSLLIQIPFFIAAYHFLSTPGLLSGVPLGPIADLAKSDALFAFRGLRINVLPVLMTLINCASAWIYTKGFSKKEKIQLYGMALVFLALLYNSPSGMALYWTANNVFSLIRNFVSKAVHPKKTAFLPGFIAGIGGRVSAALERKKGRMKTITVMLLSAFVLVVDAYLLFIHKGAVVKRAGLAAALIFLPLVPLVYDLVKKKFPGPAEGGTPRTKGDDNIDHIFVLSFFILFMLSAFTIPSSLIASSVQEFSFLVNRLLNPFGFLFALVPQFLGFFVFWPLAVYFLSSEKTRRAMVKFSVFLAAAAIINIYLFQPNYGHLTMMLVFSESLVSDPANILINLLVILFSGIVAIAVLNNFQKVVSSGLVITVCALAFIGSVNTVKIYKEYTSFRDKITVAQAVTETPVLNFSTGGKNIILVMLDRAISGYIPVIFEERPELLNSFSGFTWYKNTVSFGEFTSFGAPGLYGGYEYAPLEIQKRSGTPLVEKHNEALLMLPRIFLEQGYRVTVTDPPFANYSWVPDLTIFDDYPEINAFNLEGRFTEEWLAEKGYSAGTLDVAELAETTQSNMFRFSLLKISPVAVRNVIYDAGNWLKSVRYDGILGNANQLTLEKYIALEQLDKITEISSLQFDTYTAIDNNLTHQPSLLHTLVDIGNGPFADQPHFHVNMAAMLLLGEWFDRLKEYGVYDNSRIIVVSDHGKAGVRVPENIRLPAGSLVSYQALLMVKDFDSKGELAADGSFMTNADVPLIALEGIAARPVNPWTGNEIKTEKENGVTITSSASSQVRPDSNTFAIKNNEWLHVHTNIYDRENWTRVIVE